MRALLRFLGVVVTLVALAARAQDAGPPQKDYVPKGGTGRVVVVISGQTGASNYTSIAQDIADAGYYTVLVDGNDFWIKGGGGNALLQGVIARAQASPHAVAGKVGVVAFSLGGATALTYAAPLTRGATLCRAHGWNGGLELVLKGGQVGSDDFFQEVMS